MGGGIMLEHTFSYPGQNELNMYYCGKRIKTPNHSYGPEIRTHFLIVYIKEGNATLFRKNGNIRLHSGQLLVMFPNEYVHYEVDKDSMWTISWIGVFGNKVMEFLNQSGITPDNPICQIKLTSRIDNLMEEIYNISLSNALFDKIKCIGLLYEFFSEIIYNENIPIKPDYVTEAKHIIEYNFDKDITVSQISAMLHIQPCYFTRVFTESMGVSPKKYILERKLQRAVQLMKNTNYTLIEISNSVGIYDSLYFSRLFKKKMGISPSEYIKMIKKTRT